MKTKTKITWGSRLLGAVPALGAGLALGNGDVALAVGLLAISLVIGAYGAVLYLAYLISHSEL